MTDEPRIERLTAMAERLTAMLERDIAALKEGRPRDLSVNDPEFQRLTVVYGREAKGFDVRLAQGARAELRSRFIAITGRFREVLQLHGRLLTRMKNASEGVIRAIAEEVERLNAPARTYGPKPDATPRPPAAMLFNRVV